MFDRLFTLCYQFAHRHRAAVLGLISLATIGSVFGLTLVKYDGNLDLMLPPEPGLTRGMDLLRDSNLSDKVIVSLELTDSAKSKKELFHAVDQLAASLGPPFFTKITSGVSVANVMDEFSLLQYGPQIFGEADLAKIDGLLTRETVATKMRSIYQQSLRPASIFTSSLSRSDPLGINVLLMDKLRALPASMSYDVNVEDGHFISRDGRHAMLIIQTPVKMMDAQRSKEMVAALQEKLKMLPSFIRADVVSGHLHTVSNEKVIKRDIAVASTISTIAFLLLFFLVFRDPRIFWVFVIPVVAVVWSIIIAAGIEGRLSYLVIGFGSAIAGISCDYGLHVYIALKRRAATEQMTKLARLMTIDAVTTMASFGILYFSMIRGYHQLALFSMLCVFICLVLSLFVLPLALFWKGTAEHLETHDDRSTSISVPAKASIGIWVLLTGIALFLAPSVKFDSDFKRFDGSGPEIAKAEHRFHEVWGGKVNQAIFVVTGKTLEEAMEANDRVLLEASRLVGSGDFTSLANFWPSLKQRTENSDRWDRFWKQGREQKLKALIGQTASAYQFSDQAFAPFFEGLYGQRTDGTEPAGVIAQLRERFVVNKNGSYRILSYFPDKADYVDALTELSKKYPGSFIVSNKSMSTAIASFTAQESRLLAPLAILVNVFLAWLFFRNWKETFISLVPVATGMIWFVGIMALCGIPLNAVNIVAAIISTGVIVDYGIGMTYDFRHKLCIGTVIAVTLSASTNVIGSGVLLFADYPALYSTGVALVICMVAGYLSSLIVVPALCSIMGTSRSGAAL